MTRDSGFELAQLNVGYTLEPLTSKRLAGFVEQLDPVNAVADRAPGFCWRLQGEDGNATALRGDHDVELLLNMSTWASLESLSAFVFGGPHVEVLRRRRDWFVKLTEAVTVLWWVPAGHRPAIAEAEERLAWLRAAGPTAEAFTFRRPFPPPTA